MILWCDGAHGARENMRRDALLLARASEAGGDPAAREPVLRLFAFDPAGITLGRSQHPEACLDLARCRADGIEWAVRPTGGRAIFHAEEWTYAFAAPIDDPAWGGTLRDSYARVSRLVHDSLRMLGAPVSLAAARLHGDAPAAPRGEPSCFASTARHEIELNGRKLVGSAQRRTATALLQQGSVLLGPGHLRLADYVALDAAARERERRRLEARSATLGALLGTDAPLERWADAVARTAGSGVRRISAAETQSLLTLSERAPYTAPAI